MAPPVGEQLALDLDVLHPAGVGWQLDRRQRAHERQAHRVARLRVEVHPLHVAHQVARRLVELLAFPLVVVQPEGVAVGAVELGVHAQQRLHVIVARGDGLEARDGIAEGRPVDRGHRIGGERAHVHPEEGRAVAFVVHLEPGLLVVAAAHEHVHAPGDRGVADGRAHRDLEPGPLGSERCGRDQGEQGGGAETHGRSPRQKGAVV